MKPTHSNPNEQRYLLEQENHKKDRRVSLLLGLVLGIIITKAVMTAVSYL